MKRPRLKVIKEATSKINSRDKRVFLVATPTTTVLKCYKEKKLQSTISILFKKT